MTIDNDELMRLRTVGTISYLRLARSLMHLARLENAVEFEAPVLIDRREAVQEKTPLFAGSIWDLHGREWGGRRLRLLQLCSH